MSEQDEGEVRLEGIVRAVRYDPGAKGKQFLGAILECADGREWVIDYDEQSPFHVFANHQVVVSGRPYTPEGQQIGGDRIAGHFRVSTMRLVEVTPTAEIIAVGPAHHFSGRLERGTSEGEALLTFVSTNGDTFMVANDPAGAATGRNVDVLAYAVELSPSTRKTTTAEYLWVICPHSATDLRKWRKRRSQK